MKVVVQRVRSSSVEVNQQIVGTIGRGLNLLVGIALEDTFADVEWMAQKCLNLRIFPEEKIDTLSEKSSQRFNRSVQDIQGEILVVSQFTLYGDCRKGRRPSFENAASPDLAKPLYLHFIEQLKQSGLEIATGRFGASMQVAIDNDGPVTLIIER